MRKRIRIDADITGTQNTHGEVVRNLQPINEIWAKVEPVGGTKALGGEQPQALVTLLIKTRFHPAIVPSRRLFFDGRSFEINRVIDVEEKHAELWLIAKEQVSS